MTLNIWCDVTKFPPFLPTAYAKKMSKNHGVLFCLTDRIKFLGTDLTKNYIILVNVCLKT